MSKSKNSAGETTDASMQATIKNLPKLTQLITELTPAVEQGRFDVAQQISPQFARLANELLDTEGRRSAQIGGEISAANRNQQVTSELETLRGPGKELLAAATEAAREADPEFFEGREAAGAKLLELLNGVSVDGSGGELAASERGINRLNQGRTSGVGSNTDTIRNAINFGDERLKRVGAVSAAINTASNLLPATRQGIDTFAQATGRAGTTNLGQQTNTGVRTQSNDTLSQGQQVFGEANSNARQANQLNSDNSFANNFSKIAGGIGSIAGP